MPYSQGPFVLGPRLTDVANGGIDPEGCYQTISMLGWSEFANVVVRLMGSDTDSAEGLANARLFVESWAMAEAMRRFCARVEAGEVRSKRTYAEFKAILARIDDEPDTSDIPEAGEAFFEAAKLRLPEPESEPMISAEHKADLIDLAIIAEHTHPESGTIEALFRDAFAIICPRPETSSNPVEHDACSKWVNFADAFQDMVRASAWESAALMLRPERVRYTLEGDASGSLPFQYRAYADYAQTASPRSPFKGTGRLHGLALFAAFLRVHGRA